VLGHDQRGARWLDLAAGSGMVALEAWSRGATVVAIERDGRAAAALRGVVSSWCAEVEVLAGDGARLADGLGRFDVAYVDPPYDAPSAELVRAAARVSPVVVLETGDGDAAPERVGDHVADRVRRYGRTALVVYRRAE
jgi:16S rRNA (guanine966-N2)-methyltransferase